MREAVKVSNIYNDARGLVNGLRTQIDKLEAADWLAGQDDAPMADDLAKKDAHVERLLTDIRGLVQRAEAAERERDAAMQAHADDIAAKDAEIERLREEVATTERYRDDVIQACAAAERERDTLRQERDAATDARREAEDSRDRAQADYQDMYRRWSALADITHGIRDVLGVGLDKTTRDLPRLVRELRDERDSWLRAKQDQDHWSDMLTNQSCARGLHADWWVDSEHNHLCPWCQLADLKARAVVLPENWREQVFDATDDSPADYVWERVTRLIESWRAEPASRAPGTPGGES